MGQQQLLLIVLGVIVVAVAVIAGIGLFNANAEESVKDELTNQCVAIGANAQQFYKKPVAMGGGGLTFTPTAGDYAIPLRMTATQNCGTIGSDGIPTAPAGYTVAVTDQQVVVTAVPNAILGYDWTVTCTVTPDNITTVVAVTAAGAAE